MPEVKAIAPTNAPFDPTIDFSPEEYQDLLDEPAPVTAPTPAPATAPASTPAPAVSAQTPTTPAAPTEQQKHPKSLVLRARQLGYTETEISVKGTDALRTEVEADEREVYAERRRLHAPAAPQQATAAPSAAAPASAPTAPAQPAPAAVAEEDLLAGVNLEDYDQGLATFLKKVAERLKGDNPKLKEIEERVGRLHEKELARESQAFWGTFDGLLAKHPHVYGSKGANGTDQTTAEFARIRTVYNELAARAQAGQITSIDKDFAEVHGMLFGGFAAAATPAVEPEQATLSESYGLNGHANGTVPRSVPPKDPATGKFVKSPETADEDRLREEAFARAATPQPTARKVEELPFGDERAAKKLAERMRSRGMSTEPS